MTRRRVTSGLRRANSSRYNGVRHGVTTRNPRTAGTHCGTFPLLSALSILPLAPLGPTTAARRGSVLGVLSRYIRHLEFPMALPPNGWPDNGPLHSTRERANHSYANGLSRQVQGQPPPPERGERSWLDSQTRHAHARKNIYAAAAHRDTRTKPG